MNNLSYPLTITFKFGVINPQFSVKDDSGRTIAYVKQKAFKMKEDITVFTDDTMSTPIYTIKADRWLDYNASYSFTDANGKDCGRIVRKGARSI